MSSLNEKAMEIESCQVAKSVKLLVLDYLVHFCHLVHGWKFAFPGS